MDLEPGRVTWVGHSFGAATTIQFVKSVYYHQHLPSLKSTEHENDEDWRPLLDARSNSELVNQITPDSPVALLDLWSMPLRSEVTTWLWERPLPCYNRTPSESVVHRPSVVSIMSAEFHKYTDMLKRTKAALSAKPADAVTAIKYMKPSQVSGLEQTAHSTAMATPPNKAVSDVEVEVEVRTAGNVEGDANLEVDTAEASPTSSASVSPIPSRTSSPGPGDNRSASSSTTSVVPSFDLDLGPSSQMNRSSSSPSSDPLLYLVPDSAHLSQSDFGVLFPNLTRYLMKSQDPEETIQLNVRAVLSIMRGQGLEVESYNGGKENDGEDDILTERCRERRFLKVPLVDVD